MDDRDLYAALLDAARHNRPVALATVVRAKGSTPRDAGSRMLMDAEGRAVGTIGGGCGEAEVLEAAREVIRSGRPRLLRVELTEDVESWSPAVCGGVMDVFVEPVRASEPGERTA
ncbi:MAG: XdhC family protein [Acidobacteriota bacterium]